MKYDYRDDPITVGFYPGLSLGKLAVAGTVDRPRENIIGAAHRLAPGMGLLGAGVGGVILLGYALGWSRLWRPLEQGPSTNPWIALCLILLGLAGLTARPLRIGPMSLSLAGAAALITIVRTVMALSGYNQAFNAFLLPVEVVADETLDGRLTNVVGYNAAAMVLLLALAFLLARLRRPTAAQIVALLAALPPFVCLIGYAYGVQSFYGQMALPTLLGGIACTQALLLRTAHRGPVRRYLTRAPGGRLSRYQAAALVLICLTPGFFAARTGIGFGMEFMPIVSALAIVLVLIIIGTAAYHSHRMARWRGRRRIYESSPLARDLNGAADRGEIFLRYQPQIDLVTRRLVGVEALVGWRSPVHGVLPPADFVPLAEATGAIIGLGDWVLRAACEQAVRWQDGDISKAIVSVNVSPIQLNDADFVEAVKRVLRQTGLPASRLILEITENIMVRPEDRSVRALYDLHEIGVGVAIDDFGTGYSSLSYLRRLPSHYLKIDKSFVRELPQSDSAAAIARAIIAMGQSLGMRIIAEGIETWGQALFLAEARCDEGQGYFFGYPMTADELILWADEWPHRMAGLAGMPWGTTGAMAGSVRSGDARDELTVARPTPPPEASCVPA